MSLDTPTTENAATLYRMVKDKHVCPYGLKAKDRLEREGYTVDDKWLTTREETDAFKSEHAVKTTPQIWVGDERIGGYDALRKRLGDRVPEKGETSYQPVIALFAMAAAMALAMSWTAYGSFLTVQAAEWFIAVSMCLLALQKLKDIESFSTMFLNYDLLAQRQVRYGYVYPFVEGIAGVLMIGGGIFGVIAAPFALFVATIGAVSVFKAVYIDKRELKCACVGGDTSVPLGFVSLTENLMMMAMAVWMLVK